MKIIHGVRSLSAPFTRSVLTIGNFDGVHLGHQALIQEVLKRSQRTGVPSVVMTFEPHPVKVLYPDRGLKRIFDLEDQHERLEALGVDALVIEPFSREFSQLTPERYILDWIYRPFCPELLVVGYDFTFGANRAGTIDYLKLKAHEIGFDVEVVPPVKVGEHLASSSRIRKSLAEGDVRLAAALLGRRFYVRGLVEKGAGRGRTIGFPTANLRVSSETVPAAGVYAAFAHAGGRRLPAAVNIGRNPTFQDPTTIALSVEAHLIDFTGDLYGEEIRIEFVDRLRDEKRFDSVADLVAQIGADVARARELCKEFLQSEASS